jgi:hypothetical protein
MSAPKCQEKSPYEGSPSITFDCHLYILVNIRRETRNLAVLNGLPKAYLLWCLAKEVIELNSFGISSTQGMQLDPTQSFKGNKNPPK